MKDRKQHYSVSEKAEIIFDKVLMFSRNDAEAVAKSLDTFTFSQLRGLSKAINLMARGKMEVK